MKIFLIGSASVATEHSDYDRQNEILSSTLNSLGRDLVCAGHDVLVCSPFPDSADLFAVRGAKSALGMRPGPVIEFHCPSLTKVREELVLQELATCERIKTFFYPVSADENGIPELTFTWLVAQLAALRRSDAVIAVGGKLNGPASLLLAVAEGQSKQILPLSFLAGAAGQSFDRQQYELNSRIGDDITVLQDHRHVDRIVRLVEKLHEIKPKNFDKSEPVRIFLSYPAERELDADLAEMILRRKGCIVYRDEENFMPGHSIQGQIKEHIHQSTVFLALWCREYACSPWCFDELELALSMLEKNAISLWLLRLDDTRIVPPGARDLTNYSVHDRKELEAVIRNLLMKLDSTERNI